MIKPGQTVSHFEIIENGNYIYYQDARSIYRVPVEYETGFKMLGPSELVHRSEGDSRFTRFIRTEAGFS